MKIMLSQQIKWTEKWLKETLAKGESVAPIDDYVKHWKKVLKTKGDISLTQTD